MSTPTYSGVHRRLRQTRGPARGLPCVECGRAAAAWRCRCNDSSVVAGTNSSGRPVTYSTDLTEYEPACWKHANAYDAQRTRERRDHRHLAVTPLPPKPPGRRVTGQMPVTLLPAAPALFELDEEGRMR